MRHFIISILLSSQFYSQIDVLQTIFNIEKENTFLVEEAVLQEANLLMTELRKIARSYQQGTNIIDLCEKIGIKIRNFNYTIQAENGRELLSSSIRNRVLDCDKLSIIYYTLAMEYRLPISLMLFPDHLMLKLTEFEELYWETTSNRLVNFVELSKIFPTKFVNSYQINNYSEFIGISYFNVGLAHLNLGKTKRALNLFRLAKQFFPLFAENDFAIANIHFQSMQYYSAIQYYQKCLSLNSNHYKAIFNLALSYKELKKYDKALQEFIKCKQFPIHDNMLDYHIALTHIGLENFNDAISYLHHSLKLNDDKIFIHVQLADLYHQLGRFEEELQLYNLLFKRNPKDKEILLKLAYLYGLQKKFNESDYFKRLAQNL